MTMEREGAAEDLLFCLSGFSASDDEEIRRLSSLLERMIRIKRQFSPKHRIAVAIHNNASLTVVREPATATSLHDALSSQRSNLTRNTECDLARPICSHQDLLRREPALDKKACACTSAS
ncbi:hypothetical protein PINS_up015193 [Pythium insidiosum]|nr:hypothetical protein PINS_up015193 [Pythium insidiosum]